MAGRQFVCNEHIALPLDAGIIAATQYNSRKGKVIWGKKIQVSIKLQLFQIMAPMAGSASSEKC